MTSEIDIIGRRKWADSFYADAFNRYDINEEHPLSPDLPHTPSKSKVMGIQRAICAALLTFGISTQVLEVGKPSSQQEPQAPIVHGFTPEPNPDFNSQFSSIPQVPEDFTGLKSPSPEDRKIIEKLSAYSLVANSSEMSANTLLLPLVTSAEIEVDKPPVEKLRESLGKLGIKVDILNNYVEPTDPRSMLEGTIFSAEQMATGYDEAKLIVQTLGITLPITSLIVNLTIDQKPNCYAGVGKYDRWVHLPDVNINDPNLPSAEQALWRRCELAEFFHAVQLVMQRNETLLLNPYTAEGLSTLSELLLEYTALREGSESMIKPTREEVRFLLDFVLSTSASFRPQIKYHEDGEPYSANYFGLTYPLLLDLIYLNDSSDERYNPIAYQQIVEQSSMLLTLNGLQAVIESDNWFRDFLVYAAIAQKPEAVDKIENIHGPYPQIYSAIMAGVEKGLIYNSASYAQATQLLLSGENIDATMRQNREWVQIMTLEGGIDAVSTVIESGVYTGELEVMLVVDVAGFRGNTQGREFISYNFSGERIMKTSSGATAIFVPETFYVDGREFKIFGSNVFAFIQVKIKGTDKVFRFRFKTD